VNIAALNVYVKVVMPLIFPVVRFLNFIFSLPCVKTKFCAVPKRWLVLAGIG